MTFNIEIPGFFENPTEIALEPGSSTFFVGANGSGKTRLASKAEVHWGDKAHRISAHRSLSLNPTVAKISEREALSSLRFGYANIGKGEGQNYRYGHRWASKAETILLNDFDYVVQALFADQSNIALRSHNAAHAKEKDRELEYTKFQRLVSIWERVLPHRQLIVTGDDIRTASDGQPQYSAAEMSDGERAVFYMLGQVLVAEEASILIFDEPELHVHRAILGRLWDEAEAARPDCAFLVITHDLEFAASRPGQKFVVRRYQAPGQWELERVPDGTGFSEEIATLILGSRKPILFIEGTGASLDVAIYRACYPNWTVLPQGSCENVIHAVSMMRQNASLTRITCAGIVDADDHSAEDKERLAGLGVVTLPVSEIENVILLPEVSAAILKEEGYEDKEQKEKLNLLMKDVIAEIQRAGAAEQVVLRYCRRRIDRTLKKIDFTDVATSDELASVYVERSSALDVSAVAAEARGRIEEAIASENLSNLLANVDNKAFLALAAKHLRNTSKTAFESWLARALRDPKRTTLRAALGGVLPAVQAS